jgi:hypothetical protein
MDNKTTFEKYNPDVTALVTKDVNGLTLVWSEELERYVLPVPDRSPFQIVFDEISGKLVQVEVKVENADFIYRDRTAQAPDGTKFRERVFIGRIPKKGTGIDGAQDVEFEEVIVPDPEVQRALIEARKLQLKRVFIENILAINAAFLVGSLISVVFFFWYLISSLDVFIVALSTGAAPALGEVGYVLIWAVGIVLLAFFGKYTLPALFRRGPSVSFESFQPTKEETQTTNINVNVNQGSRTSGGGAQAYVDNRQL